MRAQTARALAADRLALTRPGSTPPPRQAELATAPGMKPPATPPTINAPPTLQGALETSNVGPATVVSPAAAPAPPRRSPPPPPAAVAAPTKSNTGVLVGVAVGALVLVLGVGAAGWYVLGRRAAQPSAAGGISGTAGATAGGATSTVPPPPLPTPPRATPPPPAPQAAAP